MKIIKTLRRKNHTIKVYFDDTKDKPYFGQVVTSDGAVTNTTRQYQLCDALEFAKEAAENLEEQQRRDEKNGLYSDLEDVAN